MTAAPLVGLAERVTAALVEYDGDDFWPVAHRHTNNTEHVLVTCEVSSFWRSMPGQATRSAIVQQVTGYTDALRAAGLGAVAWGHNVQPWVVLVAADQESAEEQAPAVWAELAEANGKDGDVS